MLSRCLRPLFVVLFSCCAAVAFNATAASKHSTHHSRSSHKATGPALVVRGDIVTSRALVDAIAKAYEASGAGRIEVQPFNTISGIDAALAGSADIAASARPGFAGRAQEAGLNFTPVAWDALVMITSPDNPVGSITLKQLRDVYYGEITNWKDLGGKDEPIDLYTVASPLDGAEYSLRRLLYGSGDARVMMPRMYINVATLEQGVALDPKSLGLSTLSGVHDNKKVKIIPIEGVLPTAATVADGSYPLYSTIYLASSPTSPHAAEIAKFMDFLNTDKARKLMREHDLLPYADAPVLTAQTIDQQIAAINTKMVGEGLQPATQAIAQAATPTPVSAPGATYSHDVSVAPGSERTALARLNLMQARAQKEAASKQATEQTPVVAASATVATPTPSSGKLGSDVSTTAPASASTASVASPADRVAATAAGNAALSKAEATAPSNPVMISANGTVTPVPDPSPTKAGGSYTVSKGDTLSSISRKYSVSVSDLRKWNGLKGDTLRIGQVLKLSGAP